jgi:hypothetical protein
MYKLRGEEQTALNIIFHFCWNRKKIMHPTRKCKEKVVFILSRSVINVICVGRDLVRQQTYRITRGYILVIDLINVMCVGRHLLRQDT